MSFDGSKIAAGDFASHGIVGKANKLPGPTAENKKAFDELVREVVAVKLNALIDELLGSTAAAQLGVDDDTLSMGVTSVQEALEALQAAITQSALPEGGIDTGDIKNGAVTAAKLDSELSLPYSVVGLTADQVIPIYIQADDPESGDPDGIYLVTGS